MGQLLPEQFPLLGVGNGQVQGATGGRHTQRTDHQPLPGQLPHQVDEALAFLAQQGRGRNPHVGEEQLGGVTGVLADLVQIAALAEARQRGIDQEQADAFGTGGRVGLGRNDHHVGVLAVGDEGLGAIQDVIVAILDRAGANGLQVAAGARLGHGDGAHGFTGDHLGQPVLSLLLTAHVAEVRRDDVRVHHDVGGQGTESHARQLFADDHGILEGRATATHFFRNVYAEHAGVTQGVPELARHQAGLFPGFVVRLHLGFEGFDHRIPEQAQLFLINRGSHCCLLQ